MTNTVFTGAGGRTRTELFFFFTKQTSPNIIIFENQNKGIPIWINEVAARLISQSSAKWRDYTHNFKKP